jgi:predicted aspartyl protease
VTRFDPVRRQFLALGGTSLALASVVAHARTPWHGGTPLADRTEEPPPVAAPEPPGVRLTAARDATHRLTVDVRINGLGPCRFLVDTGADRSVLATEVAAAIGLPLGDAVTLRGVVRAVGTETVSIKELSFGPIRCHNLLIPILPAELLGADGYLGLDVLDKHLVTLDFKRQTLQVTEPRSRFSALWVARNEVRVRATGTGGHLRALNCIVDGVAAAAFIDTGGDVCAGNSALSTALANRDPLYESLGRVSLTDVTGGAISGNGTIVHRIQLNEVTFTDCPLVMADFEVFDVWGLRDRPALLIGVNLLRQFARVSIDYGLKELRFDLASSSSPQPWPINVA